MKKALLAGACVLAIGGYSIKEHHDQEVTIHSQETQIDSLIKSNKELNQKQINLNKSLENVSDELIELREKNAELQHDNDTLKSEKKHLEQRLSKLLHIEATAYTQDCNTGCIGITKTGLNVKETTYYKGKQIIAVDPKVIPLGSTVKVHTKNGSFVATAQDTGGDIKGNRIDILVPNERRAKEFGRQQVTVEII